MDQGSHAQAKATTHNPVPQLSAIGNTTFVDFSYPVPSRTGKPHMDGAGKAHMDHSDPYNHLGRGSMMEHRGSMASATRRTSFTSNGPYFHIQEESIEESDEGSPESNRERAISMGDGYGDDFGLGRGSNGDGKDMSGKSREDGDGPTPPWSELRTKAGKERKRLPLACIACRRKKIRCSGEKPACKHCLKSRIPCVYKITTRKAAPRTDYMAMLDKRLKRMEERIIKIVPKEEYDPTLVTRAQVKPILPGTAPMRNVAGKKRAAEDAFGAELDAWAKSNSRNTNEDVAAGSSLHMQEVEESRLLSEGADSLPSQDIQEHLAEVFFDNLYGQSYHLLHKPSFMRKLKAGTVPPVLMLSVCAVSARFSTHPKLSSSPAFLRGESWAAEARNIVMKRYDWPNVTILTCLLLLALHEFGTCYGGRSWALGGMAIRMAYTLQLHKDLEYDPMNRSSKIKLSFIDREVRRRTMWACFLMDRFTSSGTNRPMFMKEETIKAQLPIKEKFFQLDIEGPTEDLQGNVPFPISSESGQFSNAKENMGVAAYTIRSLSVWGRIVIHLFQSGDEPDVHPIWDPKARFVELEKEAQDFVNNLPNDMKYTPENLRIHETEGLANQFLFMHLVSQQSILFLNHIGAHAGPTGRMPKEVPRDFVAKSKAKAFEAGRRISDLLKDAESHPVNAPFSGYCAFWSSSVQIPAVFSKNATVEAAAKRNLATNVRYLSKMKRYWGAFHWTSEHLKEQFRACADAARQGSATDGSTPAASSIYHYSDWFDRYPHGVSKTDFEDPASSIRKEKGDDAVLEEKSDYRTVEEFFNTLSPSPLQLQEREVVKNKRSKTGKRPPPASQHSDTQQHPNSTIAPGASLQVPTIRAHEVTQSYSEMSADSNGNMYNEPFYYGQENIFAPHQQAMLQLDRHLVFGAYADDLEPSLGQQLIDNAGWDINMGNITGFEEPSSAWFVPFNLDPPLIGQDVDVFNSLGGMEMSYGMGGMPVNNLGNGNGNGMEGQVLGDD